MTPHVRDVIYARGRLAPHMFVPVCEAQAARRAALLLSQRTAPSSRGPARAVTPVVKQSPGSYAESGDSAPNRWAKCVE